MEEEELKEKLEFQPIKMKRRVVKLADDFSLPQKKFYYVNSYVGVFSLKGNKQDLIIFFFVYYDVEDNSSW